MLQKAGALCCVLASGDIVFFLVTNILHIIYACMATIFGVKSSEEATKSSTVELGVTVEC